MESCVISDGHTLEVVKIHLTKLKVANVEYNQDLEGYLNSLSMLIQEFNKEDNKRNVNWRLHKVEEPRSSNAYFKLRPNIKMYLIIEIGLPPAYQAYQVSVHQAENVHIVIHDNESTTLSIENSPPYEESSEFSSLPNANGHNSRISSPPPILTARRIDRLNELKQNIISEHPNIKVYTRQLDVRDKSTVDQLVSSLPSDLKDIDVLVNNAGLVKGVDKIENVSSDDIDIMIDTNVKGLLYVTQAVLPRMKERQKGHIINIGSISGQQVYANGGVYCASKHAVNALSRTLLHELVDTPIRVSEINPGMVETEFSFIRFGGDKAKADKVYEGITPLTGEDIAETIVFVASRPDHVNIADVTLYPVNQ
ncbi:8650_t:CDS:10, partial [Racocetra persica]